MKPDDQLESELRQLFDQTADQPSAAQLTKLTARAVDVPQRVPRWSRWLDTRVMVPALAAALAAGAALLMFNGSPSDPGLAINQTSAPAPEPRGSRSVVAVEDEPVVRLVGFDMESTWEPDDEFESLFGPPPDANLDAWLLATNELMQDGI